VSIQLQPIAALLRGEKATDIQGMFGLMDPGGSVKAVGEKYLDTDWDQMLTPQLPSP
jgi:hypothetical protein